jgi:hypothetical protein
LAVVRCLETGMHAFHPALERLAVENAPIVERPIQPSGGPLHGAVGRPLRISQRGACHSPFTDAGLLHGAARPFESAIDSRADLGLEVAEIATRVGVAVISALRDEAGRGGGNHGDNQ